MFQSLPTAAEMEAAGFSPADYEGDEVEVWPEHHDAFWLFRSMRTQWNLAPMGGVVGLNYGPLFHKMDRMSLSRERYEELEEQIREMEDAAIQELRKK